MQFESFICLFPACIVMSIIAGVLASVCSCYYPCLLSRRAYYVVKSKRMQKILISTQSNRSPNSKTAPEDRNKMSFLGCICWIINLFWTVSTCSILIYLRVMDIILPRVESIALAEHWEAPFMSLFRMEYLYFFCLIFIFYQLDYAIGKHIHSQKS